MIDIKAKEIVLVDIDLLVENPKNNNVHPQDQIERLAKIIKNQGFRNPLVVSNRSGFVICGHGRIAAARMAGMKQVPVIYQDFENEAQEYAHLTADNAIASWASLDLSAINTEMLDLGPDFDIEMLGIKDFAIEPIEKFEPQSDEDAVPDVAKETVVKPGDVWILGKHRLMCQDSTNIDAVEKLMAGEMADIVWTDPPYNVALGMESAEQAKARGRRTDGLTVMNDKMEDGDFRNFLYEVFLNACTFARPGAALYVAHADSEGYNFRGACRDSGWLVKQCLIWKKSALVMGRQDYQWIHEPILYGWKDGAAHTWKSDRKQTTVLEFAKPSRNVEHPTMKPVELVSYCLSNSSDERAVVLDMFGGSGTTLIASEKGGRVSRLMELDPKYCDVIVRRWQEYTGKEALHEESGKTWSMLRSELPNQ